jgi:hypothetical protein
LLRADAAGRDPLALGAELARRLREQGAEALLQARG